MARTDATAVKEVLAPAKDYDLVNNPSLTRFIAAANLLTSRVAACAVRRSDPLSDEELLELETWLAAHFYKMSDQQAMSESDQGASTSYRATGGLNLDGSTYGQTAQTLDFSGCLTTVTSGSVAFGAWLGKPPSEQTDYSDRR